MDELKRFFLDEEGATITEYAAVIAAGVVMALALIALFNLVASQLEKGSSWFGG